MTWRPKTLVDTDALQLVENVALNIAGHHKMSAVTADKGMGKTWLTKALIARQAQIGIPGRILHVEFITDEDIKSVLRSIVVALEIRKIKMPTSPTEAFQLVSQLLTFKGVSLLVIDNAHFLSVQTLETLGRLSSSDTKPTPWADTLVQPSLSEKDSKGAGLGILLTALDLGDAKLATLKNSCDWHGLHPLPPLLFNEMAALLSHYNERFLPILNAARIPESKEIRFLASLYALTEGAFAGFERILRRFDPVLASSDSLPLNIEQLEIALNKYAKDNERILTPANPLPAITVL